VVVLAQEVHGAAEAGHRIIMVIPESKKTPTLLPHEVRWHYGGRRWPTMDELAHAVGAQCATSSRPLPHSSIAPTAPMPIPHRRHRAVGALLVRVSSEGRR
jgi:hypothetical protein